MSGWTNRNPGHPLEAARYPRVLQLIHAGVALLVGAQFALILLLHQMQSVRYGQMLLGLHRQFGVLILCLIVGRLAVGVLRRPPASPNHFPAWQRGAALVVHGAIFLLLLLQPVLGFLSTWSRGDQVLLLGFVKLPTLIQLTADQGKPIAAFHAWLGWGLAGLVGVHLAAVAFNPLVRKTSVMERMLPAPRLDRLVNRMPLIAQLALVCGAILVMTTAAGLYSAHQYERLDKLRADIAVTTTGPLDDLRAAQLDLKSLAPLGLASESSDALVRGARTVAQELTDVAAKLTDPDALAGARAASGALSTLTHTAAPAATYGEADAQLQKAIDSEAMLAFQRNNEIDQFGATGHDLIILALAPTILVATVLAFILSRSILTALAQARGLLRSVATAASAPTIQVEGNGEFAALVRDITDMRAAIERREQQSAERQLAELAQAERQLSMEAQAEIARRHSQEETVVVSGVAEGLAALSRGELGFRLQRAFPEAYEPMRQDFNRTLADLERMITAISSTARVLESNSAGVAKAVDQLSQRTERQTTGITETGSALRDLTEGMVRSAKDLGEAGRVVAAASAEAEQSNAIVSEAIKAMNNIEGSSSQISQIVSVINEIAFQTNLLALNAGVEAARAGDSGRGFAVVALEVRSLSMRSAEASKQIGALIEQSRVHVASGVELVGRTGTAFHRINTDIGKVQGVVQGIVTSSGEQAKSLDKVNQAVIQIESIAGQNAAMAEQSSRAVAEMADGVEALDQLMSAFVVGADDKGRTVKRYA